MNIFNSKPADAGALLERTSSSYVKAVGFSQKGNIQRATNIVNKALSRVSDSGFVKIENANVVSSSGMGGACDVTTGARPALGNLRNPLAILYDSEILYYTDWQAQRVVDLPVTDMMKKPYKLGGLTEDESKRVEAYQERLNLYSVLRQALKMERLYGGSVIFMGIRSDIDDSSQPVDTDKIDKDDLLFLNALSRTYITGTTVQSDPTLPFYGKPEFYHINGHRVHRSRLLIFDGQPLTYMKQHPFSAGHYHYNDHFGHPILARIKDDLLRATGTRQAAMQLIERASVLLFSGDIQSASAFKDANQNIAALQKIVNEMSNYRAALINTVAGNEASITTVPANFGAVPELIMTKLQVISAASGIPGAIFLGQAPGGLNATGESDIINYRDTLEATREHHVKPRIGELNSVMLPSAGISVDPNQVEIIFPPLETANDKEMAEVRALDTQNVVSMVASGVISYEEGIAELVDKDVLSTTPSEFPDPEPPVFDNTDVQTPGVDDDINKTKGKTGDDSRTAR